MTNVIIPLLNTRLLTTNYFRDLFELCELKEDANDGTHPLQYSSQGEFKQVTNFDESNGVCYWRKTGAITSSELDNGLISSNKYVRLTIPLRLVACVKRELMSIDNPYNGELLAYDLFAVLNANLNGTIRTTLGARQIGLSIRSLEDNKIQILETELKKSKTLSDDFVICAINLDVLVDIQQRCIVSLCD